MQHKRTFTVAFHVTEVAAALKRAFPTHLAVQAMPDGAEASIVDGHVTFAWHYTTDGLDWPTPPDPSCSGGVSGLGVKLPV